MFDEDDEDEMDDMDNFPTEDEEIDWNTRCEKCQFYQGSVHVQDQTWKGYCTFDNNPFDPHRVYNTAEKCAVGMAIDLAKDPNDKDKSICEKCQQSIQEFTLAATRHQKGTFKGLIECVGIFCVNCKETEPTKTTQEIANEYRTKFEFREEDYWDAAYKNQIEKDRKSVV